MRNEAFDRATLIFSLFDADGSGRLTAGDFELMAERVIDAAADSDAAAKSAMIAAFRKYWATLAAELDSNQDEEIDYDEFIACVLSPERFGETVGEFADALAALGDPDGDGLIERPVFTALMTAIGFETDNINTLFDAFGPDDADRITVATWVSGIKDYYSPDGADIPGDLLVGKQPA
ncbi:EF-hand domain-containing protein [Actinokineospora iranica]|uniref:Ca2+-binding protein, EF-hand superfamily n=1 Tax=Actinokineospora iranica TaxID=1271860 RepID=A0A1G6JZN5_9PSEU|nr:calcium-binding protein [Actinokineospora iranica]SDC23496.1 Ca2+-binding protein, EF-hand superfamily [Actinokineospora iranica]